MIDGGEGFDYLIRDSPNHLNFSDIASKVHNIEAIHLGDRHANTLTLTLSDVLNASSQTEALVIQGGEGDQVDIDQDSWRKIGDQIFNGATYAVYANEGDVHASLWVQAGIAVI